MFVNYDNSSDSENEEDNQKKPVIPQQQIQKPIEVPKQNEEVQKKKIKLLNFNQVMKKADEKSSSMATSSSGSYSQNLIKEANKMDIQLNNSNKPANKQLNSKRKLPQDCDDDDLEVDCPVEQKYHKLNEKEEEIQQRKMEEESKYQAQKGAQQQKKPMFVPPQARSKKGNVSTEF